MKLFRKKTKIRLEEWVSFIAMLPFIVLVFLAVFLLNTVLDNRNELPSISVNSITDITGVELDTTTAGETSIGKTTTGTIPNAEAADRNISSVNGNLLVFDGTGNVVICEFLNLEKEKDENNRMWSDFTFIDGKLWVFFPSSDEEHVKENGLIRIYDPGTGILEKSFHHNFGHVNTVDYNQQTDQLLVGNLPGNKEYPAAIYVFNRVASWEKEKEDSTLLFAERVSAIIDVSQIHDRSSGKYAYATVACWGEMDDVVYVNGLYNQYWWKIRLGTGADHLGKGSFTIVTEDNYNGTYEVLWSKEFVRQYDANREVTQGVFCMDGQIHTANGHHEIQWWEWNVDANSISRVEHNIVPIYADGSVKYCVSEGIAFYDGYIYIGCLFTDKGSNNYDDNHGTCTGEHGMIRVKLK